MYLLVCKSYDYFADSVSSVNEGEMFFYYDLVSCFGQVVELESKWNNFKKSHFDCYVIFEVLGNRLEEYMRFLSREDFVKQLAERNVTVKMD